MAYALRDRKPVNYIKDDDDSYSYPSSRRSHRFKGVPSTAAAVAAVPSNSKSIKKRTPEPIVQSLNVIETYHPSRVTINPPSAASMGQIEEYMTASTVTESPNSREVTVEQVAAQASEEEEKEPAASLSPGVTIEMDDLIPILTHRAVLLDKQEAFTSHFKGHTAQLKRDLYMYLMGVAGKIPKKWDWAVSRMVEETKERDLRQNLEYRSFLAMADKFGFAVNQETATISTTIPKASSAQPYKLPSFNPDANSIVDILMSKYHIEDNGRVATEDNTATSAAPKKRKFSSISSSSLHKQPTALDRQRKFQTFFSANGAAASRQELVSVADSADEEETEEKHGNASEDVPSFLKPFNRL